MWLFAIGVAICENGVAICFWCGYLLLVWLFAKMVWLFQTAFLGLLVGAKKTGVPSLNIYMPSLKSLSPKSKSEQEAVFIGSDCIDFYLDALSAF